MSFCFALLLSVSLFGCQSQAGTQTAAAGTASAQDPAQTAQADENAVSTLVETFGKKLQLVSLLSPADTLKKSIQENYGPYVTDGLLNQWLSNPSSAPGRETSSPWPDHIEIAALTYHSAQKTYTVQGSVIELTSTEQTGGAAAKRPVMVEVVKSGGAWKISQVTLGAYKTKTAQEPAETVS